VFEGEKAKERRRDSSCWRKRVRESERECVRKRQTERECVCVRERDYYNVLNLPTTPGQDALDSRTNVLLNKLN
jgi:hypothetical protein